MTKLPPVGTVIRFTRFNRHPADAYAVVTDGTRNVALLHGVANVRAGKLGGAIEMPDPGWYVATDTEMDVWEPVADAEVPDAVWIALAQLKLKGLGV